MKIESKIKFNTVDEYFFTLPPKVRDILEEFRQTIKQAAPEAEELISYNMPAFKFHGILVYYAAHREHIGFYPGSSVVNEAFRNELAKYDTSKGTIRFPFDSPLPHELIKDIVRYRVMDNLERAKANVKRKR
jgi:uncharacterized protein YdhG (YjbR/CyaY superfamily)